MLDLTGGDEFRVFEMLFKREIFQCSMLTLFRDERSLKNRVLNTCSF